MKTSHAIDLETTRHHKKPQDTTNKKQQHTMKVIIFSQIQAVFQAINFLAHFWPQTRQAADNRGGNNKIPQDLIAVKCAVKLRNI